MQTHLQIPSSIQQINHPEFSKAGVQLFVKREDLIHPAISGNKWRKLKYSLAEIKHQNLAGFITFGGPFSNHLAAAAYAGYLAQVKMVAVIRGEEADDENPTLAFAKSCGMQFNKVSRAAYRTKSSPEFIAELKIKYPNLTIIPEGGSNILGVKGCTEILKENQQHFDFIACPMGTATTFSGLVLSAKTPTKLLGFPAIKGGDYLRDDVNNFIFEAKNTALVPATFTPAPWEIIPQFHFGGFGKVNQSLVEFMNDFFKETQIPLDPIYTGKMFFGLLELIKAGKIAEGSKILSIHTGGLQGIKPMNNRLRNKEYKIEYEKFVAAAYPTPNA